MNLYDVVKVEMTTKRVVEVIAAGVDHGKAMGVRAKQTKKGGLDQNHRFLITESGQFLQNDSFPNEVIRRKVVIHEPIYGEVEVELDLTEIATRIARIAFRNVTGKTTSLVQVQAAASLTLETITARCVYLRLNPEVKQDKLAITATVQ